jgi:hypothetical protein
VPVFEHSTEVAASAQEVFDWHTRPGAFERLVPPWEDVRVVARHGGIRDGGRIVLELRRGALRRRWVAEHTGFEEGRWFRDEQIEGPFASWTHEHRFEPESEQTCRVVDRVEYELPLGALGRAGGGYARRSLERLFSFRHERLRDDLRRHATLVRRRPLRVAITGASGTIGAELAAFLSSGGHDVIRLVRRAPRAPAEVAWDPATGAVDAAPLEGLDAVVHLSGRRIDTRWTPSRKLEIRASRVDTTRFLAETLASLGQPPRTLVAASATGIYGNRGGEELTEQSPSGTGFLAELCQAWEQATEPARDAAIRVVNLRTGVVLSRRGAPLSRLVLPFSLGLGASVGDGDQVLSWISLDDAVAAILHVLGNETVAGPVNLTSPNPVSARELVDTLAAVLARPRFLRIPPGVAGTLGGEMARETLLAGQRVLPARLLASGFAFSHPTLEATLRHELGRRPPGIGAAA